MAHNPMLKEDTKGDFSINYISVNSNIMKSFHFHDAFEILFALSEGVRCFVEDSVYSVEKGDIFLFNNMDLHRTVVPVGVIYERYVLTFKQEYIQDFSPVCSDLLECFLNRGQDFSYCMHLSEEQFKYLFVLFRKAEFYSINPVDRSDIYIKITLIEILLLINSLYQVANKLPTSKNDDNYKKIKPILSFISGNLKKNLSLSYLANTFYLSKSQLGRVFKNVTGFSVNEYIINRRIMKARELLIMKIRVTKVAEMVGFSNDTHFIRTFKKMVGLSPKRYAKTYGKVE